MSRCQSIYLVPITHLTYKNNYPDRPPQQQYPPRQTAAKRIPCDPDCHSPELAFHLLCFTATASRHAQRKRALYEEQGSRLFLFNIYSSGLMGLLSIVVSAPSASACAPMGASSPSNRPKKYASFSASGLKGLPPAGLMQAVHTLKH